MLSHDDIGWLPSSRPADRLNECASLGPFVDQRSLHSGRPRLPARVAQRSQQQSGSAGVHLTGRRNRTYEQDQDFGPTGAHRGRSKQAEWTLTDCHRSAHEHSGGFAFMGVADKVWSLPRNCCRWRPSSKAVTRKRFQVSDPNAPGSGGGLLPHQRPADPHSRADHRTARRDHPGSDTAASGAGL